MRRRSTALRARWISPLRCDPHFVLSQMELGTSPANSSPSRISATSAAIAASLLSFSHERRTVRDRPTTPARQLCATACSADRGDQDPCGHADATVDHEAREEAERDCEDNDRANGLPQQQEQSATGVFPVRTKSVATPADSMSWQCAGLARAAMQVYFELMMKNRSSSTAQE
ncbi:hypothetical protein J2777_002982 [Paraburkholderia graminis]|nr:hypothetical protein [Paraburkholderia graminis]